MTFEYRHQAAVVCDAGFVIAATSGLKPTPLWFCVKSAWLAVVLGCGIYSALLFA
jgi:hypothetical protein